MNSELGLNRKVVLPWALGALALALMVGCGGSDGGSSGGDQGGNGGSTSNGGSGNTNGGSGNTNGGSGNAPDCSQVCAALGECGVDASQCAGICDGLADACRSCLVSEGCDSPNCEAPCTGGGNGGSGGDGGSSSNGGSGNGGSGNGGADNGGTGNTEDAWGRKCSLILEDCPSDYDCQNTSGNSLQDGICTQPCTSFSDCPTFWDCQQVGSGKYCFP